MKMLVAILGFCLIGCFTRAQSVYVTNYISQCNTKIFVVNNISEADLLVYLCKNKSQAKGNDGIWYFENIFLKVIKKYILLNINHKLI